MFSLGLFFFVVSFKFSNINFFLVFFSFPTLKREILERMLTISNKIFQGILQILFCFFCAFTEAEFLLFWLWNFRISAFSYFFLVPYFYKGDTWRMQPPSNKIIHLILLFGFLWNLFFLVLIFKFSNINLLLVPFSFLILTMEILEKVLTISNKIIHGICHIRFCFFVFSRELHFCYFGFKIFEY